jgi:hypothetical protein
MRMRLVVAEYLHVCVWIEGVWISNTTGRMFDADFLSDVSGRRGSME